MVNLQNLSKSHKFPKITNLWGKYQHTCNVMGANYSTGCYNIAHWLFQPNTKSLQTLLNTKS